jgi:hypothetical protein
MPDLSRRRGSAKQPGERPAGLSYSEQLHLQFWSEFLEFVRTRRTRLDLPRPSGRQWYRISVGRAGFELSFTVRLRGPARCELYIHHRKAQSAFEQLEAKRPYIERRLGSNLTWEKPGHKGGHACRIGEYHSASVDDKRTWRELFGWFAQRARMFHSVFVPLIRRLDL